MIKTSIKPINAENTKNPEKSEVKIESLEYKGLVLRKIEDILEKGEDEEIYEFLEKYIKKYFLNILKSEKWKEDFSFLLKYFENKDIEENELKKINKTKINSKFDKYLPIHFPILKNQIKTKFKENTEKIQDKGVLIQANKNFLKNFMKKYAYIIFVFWEKVKISQLEEWLSKDIKTLSNIFFSTKGKIVQINEKETEFIEWLKKDFWDSEILKKEILVSTFRNIFKKVILEEKEFNTEKIEKNLEKELNNLYENELLELYHIFEKWKQSDWLSGKNLENIEITSKKIFKWIDIFKNMNIAFNEDFYLWYHKQGFIDEVLEKFIKKTSRIDSKNFELFREFLKLSHKKWENKYDNFLNKIAEENQKIAESKVPEELEKKENIDLEEVDFDFWNDFMEYQKYDLMFSEIIWKDGKMDFSKFINLDIDENKLDLFIKTDERLKNREKIIINQFIEIKSKQWITIEQFIRDDINNLNLLILWWRFNLKIKTLEKKWKKINLANLKDIEETPYWVIEKISQKLHFSKTLEKIYFNPNGRLHNVAAWTIEKQLGQVLKNFEKWPIDLLNVKIDTSEWKKEIKNLSSLYIPKNIKIEKTNEGQKEAINDWISSGIDICYKILQKRNSLTENEKEYLNILIEEKIISDDNYENLDQKSLENIQDLVEVLKFIKWKRKILSSMFETAKDDENKLSESLKKLLETEKENSEETGFWAEKQFYRAFQKLIKNYNWDFNKIWDLTRLRIVRKSIDELIDSVVNFIELASLDNKIEKIAIIDYTWEPANTAQKKTWYRDIKLLFTVSSWNVVELQFQYEKMLDVKENWLDISKDDYIIDKLRNESSLFTDEEMKTFLKTIKEKKLGFPKKEVLKKLLSNWNIASILSQLNIKEEDLKKEKISTNYTYNISRNLSNNLSLKDKIERLERALADKAWSEIFLDYLKSKNIKIN